MSETSGGEAYRKRRADAEAFYRIIQQLETNEPSESPTGADVFLDGIAAHGINGAAELAMDGLELPPELYVPADPSEVLEYLTWVHTTPPLTIKDKGAVDREFVLQTRLSENYIEEIRELLEFVDPTKGELSVLDFPEVKQRMRASGVEGFKKLITVLTLNMHGIAYVIDDKDDQRWNKMKTLAEDISSEVLRDYSRHLRQRVADGAERTAMRDVSNTVKDILESRERAIELAKSNIHATEWERRRLYETLPERVREQLRNFFAEVHELTPDELTDDEVH